MSATYWNTHPVAGPFETDTESISSLLQRHLAYPGWDELMPQDYTGQLVLDFGCGPGQDVIRALQRGALHVYAADIATDVLERIPQRLRWHGLPESAVTLWPLSENVSEPTLPIVDHVNVAGVLMHCADPMGALRAIRAAMKVDGWAMVYSQDSDFFQVHCGGDPAVFAECVDEGVPIVEAWEDKEFVRMCDVSRITATPLGHYGPGDLMSCFRLEPR